MLNKATFRTISKVPILSVYFCPFLVYIGTKFFCFRNMFIFRYLQTKCKKVCIFLSEKFGYLKNVRTFALSNDKDNG